MPTKAELALARYLAQMNPKSVGSEPWLEENTCRWCAGPHQTADCDTTSLERACKGAQEREDTHG